MSEDKSIDELINLAISCGAGLSQNIYNAEVLTSFTQHELRVFYKAAQAAMQPEIDKLFECQVERGNYQAELFAVRQQLAAAYKTIEQLQAKVAEAKREALEEAADKFSNLPKIDEFKSYVYLKGYPKDIVEIELRRMAADLQDRHTS